MKKNDIARQEIMVNQPQAGNQNVRIINGMQLIKIHLNVYKP
ncbi:hypothetical protein FHR92_003730 [Fontibacillus solani]|uniref:Uncharacterized protein n=1 Tax=Fontibacillus solani TaxID=1572857 RepID=A0A7W3XT46_9BACL|nr:hypothetical protein [Fontibacillus solani]MBA9087246.1 hypothetical protein [Fontibacillus solani]